jgi:outer membrane protein OmpA-like peptidoglycan-associated protein
VYLPAPRNSTGTFQVKTLAPGYKESKRSISYADPANSAASVGPDAEFVIALPLVRVKQGDYIEFTNVRFFQNTVILHPDARGELSGLAALMKENPSYKVVVHGHCNGEEARDITTLGTSTEYFATAPGNVRENVDAKRYTSLRAETVKAFLVQEGVEPSRIKTKGEGGKNLIYPKNSTLSARNDRVEVEVKKGR